MPERLRIEGWGGKSILDYKEEIGESLGYL